MGACGQPFRSIPETSARICSCHLHMDVLGRDHVANQVEQTAHCATSWHLKFCRQLLDEELGVWPVPRHIQQRPYCAPVLLDVDVIGHGLVVDDDVTWCFASFDTWKQIHQALDVLLVYLDLCDTVHNLDTSFQESHSCAPLSTFSWNFFLRKASTFSSSSSSPVMTMSST